MTSAQALNDPTMHDRRIATRHRAMTAVSVDDDKVPDQAAVSVNISATGMLLRSQEPLQVGREVNVSFRSPRDASRSVRVAGVVIREAGSHQHRDTLFPHLAAVRFDERLPLCDLPTRPMMTV